MKIYVQPEVPGYPRIVYVLRLLAQNKRIDFEILDQRTGADLTVSEGTDSDVVVSRRFHEQLDAGEFEHTRHLDEGCRVRASDGRVDALATVFYLVNSVQEWGATALDELGRFPFSESLQHRFDSIERNTVQEVIDEFVAGTPPLADLRDRRQASRVFLTHDIDSVYDAYRQDGLAALRRGEIGRLLHLLWNAAMGRPDWLNMDRIMDIESEHDVKSVFYWLVTRGKVSDRITNADYDIADRRVRAQIQSVSDRGWENGLHKSVSDKTFAQELQQLGVPARGNRYHYLKFKPPEGYRELELSGLKLDCTLGFAEAPGFRNNYGLPFAPFCEERTHAHSFVEAPLHFMDGSYQRYLELGPKDTLAHILGILEQHPRDCVFTFLWHNTFFADGKFRGYLDVYKSVLSFVRDAGYTSVSEEDIINEYSV